MTQEPRYSAPEFERESRYIENLVWDALVVESAERVLFCGFGDDAKWISRAIQAGADVTVIEHRDEVIRKYEQSGATLLRGSTSVIPAKADTFDIAIASHYLHETDPFFHAQIASELARVAKRVAIVEPGPPADALGKKIARLYSQAKRELGQFEYYQPLEYWRKLLQSVKADISAHIFAFAKVPPREYLRDTIELLLDTMEVEDAPRADLDELREIARRSDTMILPPPRFVIVGAAIGDVPQPIFTPREEPTPTPAVARAAQSKEPVPQPARMSPPPIVAPPVFGAEPPPQFPAPNFTVPEPAPAPEGMPFGTPFAVPGFPPAPGSPMPGGAPPGWQWEPPEEPKP